ncbi:MAG: MarR family transcriptional regulator [Lachnospiraceae bacterium]|nr:MarR family transcriptional regulator [Lachnospiraceae bacterium]
MATKEEIELILNGLEDTHPANFFQAMSETHMGIGAVLRYLSESDTTVTAGKISEKLRVSTARVAVLLKKMEAKGLIVKAADDSDSRVTIVRLSEQGEVLVRKMREELYQKAGAVIDAIGMERMLEFVAISRKIRDAAGLADIRCGIHDKEVEEKKPSGEDDTASEW